MIKITILIMLIVATFSCGDTNGISDDNHTLDPCPNEDYFCRLNGNKRWSDKGMNLTLSEAKEVCSNHNGRLPTISELRTLITNCPPTSSGFECKVTDNCPYNTCWNNNCEGCSFNEKDPVNYSVFNDTETLMAYNPKGFFIWNIDFSTGSIQSSTEDRKYKMRCVEKTSCKENDPFCNEVNGVLWSDLSKQTKDWEDAKEHCIQLGGKLPTISELRTLVQNNAGIESGGSCEITDECLVYECSSKPCYSSPTNSAGKYSVFGDIHSLWSASLHGTYQNKAMYIDFEKGKITTNEILNSSNMYVRCKK